MLVQRFVDWSRTASVEDRVRAVSKVCAAFRFATVPENERRTSVAVMTLALDDPSPKVRRALAEGIAPCAEAPRHIVMALARDLPSVAAPVLNGSPILLDADLVQFVEAGDEACALAIVSRATISKELSRAVIEHGGADAVARLMRHPAVILSPDALDRIAARFAERAELRALLLGNDGLAPGARRRIAALHAADLYAFAEERNWLSGRRAAQRHCEARDRHLLTAASEASADELSTLLRDAIADGHLTVTLLVRAAIEGQLPLVETAIALLSDNTIARTATAFRAVRTGPLDAVMLRAGLPKDIAGMIVAAHRVWRDAAIHAFADAQTEGTRVLRSIVRTLAARVDATTDPAITRLLADLELDIERHAALHHEEQVLLAA